MQLLDTVVTYGASGPAVEFLGEGGEKISVVMAPRPGASAEDLVQVAREMLAQVAAFGQEGGEFSDEDEAATAPHSSTDLPSKFEI